MTTMTTTILMSKSERDTGDTFGITCPPPTRVHGGYESLLIPTHVDANAFDS